MKKVDWLKIIKISIGCCFAVFLADWIGLRSATSAGIIALLSIQNTKKETLTIAGKRISAFFIAVAIAYALFTLWGYHLFSFGFFLLLFTFACYLLKLETGVSMSTVLVTHFWTAHSFHYTLIINEFLLLSIGVGIAVVINLYMPRMIHIIKQDQEEIDNSMKQILLQMSSSLIHGHEIDLEADFQFLQNRLSQALAHAYQYMNNTLSSDMRYYVRFIELRKNQQGLLKRVYRNLLKIQFVPSQAFPVSRFMKRIAESMQDYNNAEFLLSILSEMRKFYKTTPLPQTREEFEARAVLYQIAADLEALVLVKQSFAQQLSPGQIDSFWK